MEPHTVKRTTTLLLALLVTTPLITASNISVDLYGNDRSFTSQASRSNPSICSCQTLTDNITITNTGDFASTYQVQTNLNAAQPGQSTVELRPGQQKTIPIIISKSCDAQPQQQTYTVDITDTYDNTQRIERTLTTNKCQSLEAGLYRTTNSPINPCQPINYQIQTQNPAPYTESYTITTNTPSEETLDEFTLEPGQQRTTNTTLQYACKTYGDITPTITVTGERNNVETTLTDSLTINKSYPYTVEEDELTPEPQPTCTEETLKATYQVTNNAPFNNTYTVNTDLTTNKDTLSLDSGETTTFTVNATSNEPQRDNKTLQITSELGDITKTKTLQTNFDHCYDTNLDTQGNSYCQGTNYHPVSITNNGRFTTTYTVNATANGNISFTDTQKTTIQPGQTEQIRLEFNADPNQVETHDITTTATYQTRAGTTKTVTSQAQHTTYDTYQCTLAQTPQSVDARFHETLTIPITNNGIHTATYNVTTNTTTFTPQGGDLTIPSGQTTYLVLDHNEYQNTTLTEDIQLVLTNTENDYEYTNDITIQLTPTPWYENLAGYIQTTQCAQITTALILIILLTFLLGNYATLSATTTTTLNVAAIIILIALLLFTGLPPALQPETTTTTTENAINATWPANQTLTLNLNDYFTDPDSDEITYNVTNVESPLTITQANNTLQLRSTAPTTQQATITAQDTQNATNTATLALTVTKPRDNTLQGVYEANCHYLNWVLLIIALILIATLTGTKTRIRRRRDYPLDDETDNTIDESTEQDDTSKNDEDDVNRPTEENTVDEIQAWLDEHNVEYTTRMRKAELLDLVKEHNDE